MTELSRLEKAGTDRKRVGRGGSRGGTSGKGHKGQKARSGGSPRPGFEGGQMPLFRRLPKRGFTNAPFKTPVHIIDIKELSKHFGDGEQVTKDVLIEKKIIKRPKGATTFVLKVLGNEGIAKKLNVIADSFSKQAAQAIEKAGGTVQVIKER